MKRRNFIHRAIVAVAGVFVGVCRLVGAHWTYPGDLTTHLLRSHGLPYSNVRNRSHQRLLEIHDALHTGRYGIRR